MDVRTVLDRGLVAPPMRTSHSGVDQEGRTLVTFDTDFADIRGYLAC